MSYGGLSHCSAAEDHCILNTEVLKTAPMATAEMASLIFVCHHFRIYYINIYLMDVGDLNHQIKGLTVSYRST
jgi:hypothetical protein